MIIIKANKIAFGGIMAAMSVVILYIASVLPTLKLAVCLVASAVICIVMIKHGTGSALAVFIAASAVSLIVSPDKIVPFGYLLFFGNYPVVKAYIERMNKLMAEWIVKLIVFVVYVAIAFAGMKMFFAGAITFPCSQWIVFAGAVVAAGVYDVALSLFVSEIKRRFSNFI